MKVFNLKCAHGHAFEGWFKSHAAFDEQQSQGLLSCPFCESRSVEKTLSAPRLNLLSSPEMASPGQPVASPVSAERSATETMSASLAPNGPQAPALAAALQVVREMLASSEDVGERFADEARAMHAKDIPARPIHGQTDPQTAQELAEEGIPVVSIPFGKLLKSPLQ